MREAGKVGIGRVVIRSKQQLCALRPTGDVMAMSTMLFGDEVLPPDRIDELEAVGEAEASDRELTMAQQLIDSLSAEFDPGKFKDEYRERVLDLIERKAAGEEIAVQPQAEEEAPAPDLMAALEASLAEVRSGSSDTPEPKEQEARGQVAQELIVEQGRRELGLALEERHEQVARQGQELAAPRRPMAARPTPAGTLLRRPHRAQTPACRAPIHHHEPNRSPEGHRPLPPQL